MANDTQYEEAQQEHADSLYNEMETGVYDDPENTQYDPTDENAPAVIPNGFTVGNPQGEAVSNAPQEQQEAPQEAPAQAPVATTPPAPVGVPQEQVQAEPAKAEEDRPVTVVDAKELSALKARLRADAEREVIKTHYSEYVEIAEKKFAENGLEFTRRMTAEERAAQQIKDLLAKNPGLAEQFNSAK